MLITVFFSQFSGYSSFGPIQRNLEILQDYYTTIQNTTFYFSTISSVQSVITMSFSERFGCRSLVTETCVLCPISKDQADCLDHLNERWSFLLSSRSRSKMTNSPKMMNDIIISLFFEMMRIYSHPFLGGCTEQLLLELHSDQSWTSVFRTSSSKIMVCDMILNTLTGNTYSLPRNEKSRDEFQHGLEEEDQKEKGGFHVHYKKFVSPDHTRNGIQRQLGNQNPNAKTTVPNEGRCVGVYVKSLRFGQFLEKYYHSLGYSVAR